MMPNLRKRFAAALLIALCLCFSTGALAAEITGTTTPEYLSVSGNVTVTFTISNNSDAAMTDIKILHNGSEFFNTAGVVLEPGLSQTFTSTPLTVPAALIGQPIAFNVTWLENGESKSAQPTITVKSSPFMDPSVQLPESVSVTATREVSAAQASTGEVITITYTVTNSGVTPVTGVSITDREIGGRNPMVQDIVVEPGVPYVYTHEYTMGRTTVTSAPVIAYLLPDGTPGTVTVAEQVLGMINSRLSVAVEQGIATAEGQTFTLTLTNDGNQRISNIKIVDELGASVADSFQLAIGESKAVTHTVPTDAPRNVVFYIEGQDGVGQQYSDKTETYPVREYIDPAMIGIDFSVSVVEMLNSAGSITVAFTVENTGSLTMHDMVLRESTYGEITRLDTFEPGVQTINQKIHVGTPRDLTFTLEIADPSDNLYNYTAYITADYVGSVAPESGDALTVEPDTDLVAEVGSSIRSALRTVLIVLGLLTVLAGIVLIILSVLEKKERRRIARRRAARERKLREQAMEAAAMLPRSGGRDGGAPSGTTTRVPRTRE